MADPRSSSGVEIRRDARIVATALIHGERYWEAFDAMCRLRKVRIVAEHNARTENFARMVRP